MPVNVQEMGLPKLDAKPDQFKHCPPQGVRIYEPDRSFDRRRSRISRDPASGVDCEHRPDRMEEQSCDLGLDS